MEVISGFKRYFQKYLKDRFVAQKGYIWDSSTTNHSHKKRKDSLETRAELAVLRTYVENQSILELILFYLASKYKQTKEKGSDDCFWTHIFTFYFFIIMFSLLSGFFLLFFFCQDANTTGLNCAIISCTLSKKQKLALYQTHPAPIFYLLVESPPSIFPLHFMCIYFFRYTFS